MEPAVYSSIQDFMLHSKSITYLLMGAGLVGLACFWYFLCARDKDINRF